MAWFDNVRLRTKVMLGFLFVAALSLATGIVGLAGLNKLNRETVELSDSKLPAVERLASLKDMVNVMRRSEIQAPTSNSEQLLAYQKRFDASHETAQRLLKEISTLNLTQDEKRLFSGVTEHFQEYSKVGNKTFDLVDDSGGNKALAYMRETSKKNFDGLFKELDDLIKLNKKLADEGVMHARHAYTSAKWWIIGFLAGCIALSILLGGAIASSISQPVQRLAAAARDVAEGNIRTIAADSRRDEIGELSASFVTMVENLRTMIGSMTETSSQVASAATQLNSTAEQIATGTEEVASQAATVATASEEMAATSNDIAGNSLRASDGSQLANEAAMNGVKVVEKTIQVMGQIAARVTDAARTVESLGARSDQIGEIIGTIEDIADQTNLLALNAAIEAARAGEQGRGFAVVADEVRALAERTTRATREISEMIKSIQAETKGAVAAMEQGVSEVEAGTVEAGKSSDALRKILDEVNAVMVQVSQIATAAEEQTATTNEISNNIMQITEVVQETAKGTQDSAAAANQLARLAENLQGLAQQFKLM